MIIDDSVVIKNGQGRSFIEKNIISIEYSIYILGYVIWSSKFLEGSGTNATRLKDKFHKVNARYACIPNTMGRYRNDTS